MAIGLLAGTIHCLNAADGKAALPAFPDAEGFGAKATGGRGGKVIKVTNLNPSGEGSFQAACETPGPRIVVFDVSGVIPAPRESKGKRYFAVVHPDLTIAGQTAPGAGITLDGTLSFLRGGGGVSNVIVRFLRIRAGSDKKECYLQRANVRALEASGSQNIVIDHVSGSWSLDDCFDLYTARDATVQWCTDEESDIILEGGDEPHNFGLITGWSSGGPRPITIHHTLIANHRERTPCIGSFPTDFRNNVIYNAGTPSIIMFLDKRRKYTAEDFVVNLVGNCWVPGPGGLVGTRIYMAPMTLARSTFAPGRRGRIFVAGNYQEGNGGYAEPWKGQPQYVEREHAFSPVATETAEEARERVLAAAGCLPRDAVTARTIAEVRTGTGSWGRHGPGGGLMEGLEPGKAAADSDGDGMPDAWERAHGLDPADAADARKSVPAGASRGNRHQGYTYLEYYINELADILVAGAFTDTRLDTAPAKPWNRPARALAKGAQIHDSLDEMIAAIADQTLDRQPKGDTHGGWFAVQQLERMGAEATPAVARLTKLVQSGDQRTSSFAAWALGAIGPSAKDAVPALIDLINRSPDKATGKWVFNPRGFAAWALGRIGPEAATGVEALISVADGADVRIRPAAFWALSRMGPGAAPAKDTLLKHLGEQQAAVAIAQIGGPVVTDLIARLDKGKKEIRNGAAEALGFIGAAAASALPALSAMIADEDADLRSVAATAMGRIGPKPEATAVLAALLKDDAPAVRHAAARALEAAGPTAVAAIPALAAALGDQRLEIRRAAVFALGAVGREALPALLAALRRQDDADVRHYAARALGRMGPDGTAAAAELVKTLANDLEAGVRREAAWALTLLGAKDAATRAALAKACTDPDYIVATAAERALTRLGGGGESSVTRQ